METVDIKLLNYQFRFKKLHWREEFAIKFPPKSDPYKILLSHALIEISGLKVATPTEAMVVFLPLPRAVVERVFKIYKGSFPKARRFMTGSLYKAPTPANFVKRVQEDRGRVDDSADAIVDRAEQEMIEKFGRKEVEEARAIDKQVVTGSKLRGAVRVDEK